MKAAKLKTKFRRPPPPVPYRQTKEESEDVCSKPTTKVHIMNNLLIVIAHV